MSNGSNTAPKRPWEKYRTLKSCFSLTSVMDSISIASSVRLQCTTTTLFRVLRQQCLITIFIASKKHVVSNCTCLILPIRFIYDSNSATYMDIDTQRTHLVESEQPPDNCPVCLLTEQRDQEEDPRKLSSGVAWHGTNYHIHDFAMIK